jgi:excinuclease ABC subunit C
LIQSSLRQHVRTFAEDRPGIYRMYGAEDSLLYVGKSVRVRSRLLSYFRAPREEKAHRLIRETAAIRWEYVPNEFGALVREMKLIQKWRPRFNVQHKRKRIFGFVKITNERAPRLLPVSRVVPDDSAYFGPFPRVGMVGRTIRELGHLLGLRDCPGTTPVIFDDQLEFFEDGRVPLCMRADLGSCLAPCCGRVSSEAYAARVLLARKFLEGKSEEPLRILEANMNDASARLDFEYASLLRDRLERLSEFQEQLLAFRGRVEDLSFVYRVPGFKGADRLYLIRRGRIRRELIHPKNRRARERATRTIEEVYAGVERGPAALEPQDAAEVLLVAQWFRLRPSEVRRTKTPMRWLSEDGAGGDPGPVIQA